MGSDQKCSDRVPRTDSHHGSPGRSKAPNTRRIPRLRTWWRSARSGGGWRTAIERVGRAGRACCGPCATGAAGVGDDALGFLIGGAGRLIGRKRVSTPLAEHDPAERRERDAPTDPDHDGSSARQERLEQLPTERRTQPSPRRTPRASARARSAASSTRRPRRRSSDLGPAWRYSRVRKRDTSSHSDIAALHEFPDRPIPTL